MIYIYRFLTNLFYPILILLIFLRKFLNKEDKIRYKEKIFPSFFSIDTDYKKKLIWFHAASIGEVQSILPIIFKLNKKRKLEFLITTVTLSSGNLIKKKIQNFENMRHRYFPLDINFLAKIFLRKWSPNLVLFVDSEVWPNFLFQIKKAKIPSVLINGRVTEKTFNRWMIVKNFAKGIFNTFDLCLASSKRSKNLLKKLNAKNLKYFGNIKLASIIDKNNIEVNNNFFPKNKFWCAASTHAGEELLCLKTHINLKKKIRNLITIIIPRHIHRSNEIKKVSERLNLTTQILNSGDKIVAGKEILIINSFGILLSFFKYSKSVFIGKSFIKKLKSVSGQNPIEAAKLGCKIYHGPFVYNFQEIYDLFKSLKISEKITNELDLSEKLYRDFKTPKKSTDKISKNLDFLGKKILEKSVKEIDKIL